MLDIDTSLNILATQNPPNAGTLNTVGSLTVDPTDVNGYEILPKFNHGYAALQLQGETSSKLYAVNAQGNAAGAAVLVGPIGLPTGTLVGGLTVQNTDRIAFSVIGVRVSESGGNAVLTVQRSNTGGDVPAATVAFATADGTATAVVRVAPARVSLTVRPARDRSKPYVFTASGKVTLPAGTSAAACAGGRVTIRLKRGAGTLVTRNVTLGATCRFSTKLTHKVSGRGVLRSPRTLRITARFAGTARLLPRSAATRTVKAG